MKTISSQIPQTYNYVMVLYQWALKLIEKGNPILVAGIGKPTYPINIDMVSAQRKYWDEIYLKSLLSRQMLANPNFVAEIDATVDYGNPQGDLESRSTIANTLTRQFSNTIKITPENIIFTVGGSSALYNIFKIINKKYPNGIMVTSFPYYPLYRGADNCNNLFPISVINLPGFKFNSEILEISLKMANDKAIAANTCLSAFILCNPNNPLGTVLNEDELKELAVILRKYPSMHIILDEVYSDMCFGENKYISFLQVAPDLKDRIILMRSGTKAMSAAGERMAIAVTLNADMMNNLIKENIDTITHAPLSSQKAFAAAFANINEVELKNIQEFYEPQVRYVEKRLREMGAIIGDSEYQVQGGFYVLANLSKLFGMPIPDSAKVAVSTSIATKDYEIAFALLFEDHIMIAPLSDSGLSPQLGYFRITCSLGLNSLKKLMDKIEFRLGNVTTQTEFQGLAQSKSCDLYG